MKRYFVLFLMACVLAVTAVAPASAQDSWDAAICSGAEGVVWRVANATTSNLPTQAGCQSTDETYGWLVIEPWGPNEQAAQKTNPNADLNADRACFATDWTTLYSVATSMKWLNGSAWRSSNDTLKNPLTVNCANVKSDTDLGLNPWEDQVSLKTIAGTLARANELFAANKTTMAAYIGNYPNLPMTQLFTLLQMMSLNGNPIASG